LCDLNLAACRKVKDVSVLRSAGQLTTLNLKETGVTDVSWLEGCVQLEQLNLRGCHKISSIDAVSSCIQLQSLDLSDTNVVDLAPLLPLACLKIVKLARCQKLRKEALQAVSGLQITQLDLKGVAQNDWLQGVVHYFSRLESLDLSESGVVDLNYLPQLKCLKMLELQSTGVRDILPLKGVTSLERLSLMYCRSIEKKEEQQEELMQALSGLSIDGRGAALQLATIGPGHTTRPRHTSFPPTLK
jgi:Leucine-rich repeat (LRR) protein